MGILRFIPVLLSALAGIGGAFAAEPDLVRMATTTSTRSSGLLDVMVPAFEQASGYRMKLSVVGTGRALRMGRLGQVDVVLVHAPASEQRFVDNGWGIERQPVMHNDFILVGPVTDPAGIKGMQSATDALKKIAATRSGFVSRGDDSGTHKKEVQLWSSANIQPAGNWYFETGMAMGDTLKLASDKRCYTLVDRSTWLKAGKQTDLGMLLEGDPVLKNPYSLIRINPQRHAGINVKGAEAFSDWLRSAEARQLIANYRVAGEQLFYLPDGQPE